MKYTDMINPLAQDVLSQKAASVGTAANTKRAGFAGADVSLSLEQFRTTYPQADALDERIFLSRQDRLNKGIMDDIGTDLGIAFGDRLAQTVYGVTGLVGDAIDSKALSTSGWDGVAQQQAESIESEKEYSLDLRQAKANILNAATERKAAQMEDGNISTGEALGEFFGTAGDYILNPRAAVSEAAKSAADLVVMGATGGLGGAVAKNVVKQGIKKRIGTEGMQRAAAKAEVEKAGKKAALTTGSVLASGYTGVSEGTNNAIQTRDAILNIEPEVLKESSDFKELAKSMPDATFEEVRAQFAEEGARDTALISGSIAAVIGKVTGASSKFGNLANGGATKGIARETAGGFATEAVEETLQSGVGQLVSNVQVKEGNEKQDVLEGVGEAAGAGLAAGGLLGGVMSGGSRTITKSIEKLSAAREAQNSEQTAEAIQELQKENVEPTTEVKEPEVVEPANVIEKYAPERAPAENEMEVAIKTKEVIDTYSNYETDNPEVKAYVESVLEHTLNTDLSIESLRKDGKDFEAIGEALYTARSINMDLTVTGANLLSGTTLSEIDAQTVANLATTLNPQESVKADYNTVAKVINNIEIGDTERLVMSLTKKKTDLGQDESSAQVDALLETIGDVVLYSEDKLGQLTKETLDLFAENTQDADKKKLFEFVSTLRANEVDTKGKPLTGTERVRAELFGDKGDRTVGKHVDTFLTALGKGETAKAEAVYDLFIGYLQSNQTRKLAALEGLKADPSQRKAVWDTSGAMGSGSQEFEYRGMGKLQHTINAVSKDLDTLNHIDTLARDILDPTGKKVEEVVVKPTKVVLTGSGRVPTNLLAKDQAKSDQANKFIGYGAENTSTAEYQSAWGENANTGVYSAEDTVFVSVNGGKGKEFTAKSATANEVNKAVEAGATIIADTFEARNRSYNKTGEGRLAKHLSLKGYEEVDSGSGVWTKAKQDSKTFPVAETGKPYKATTFHGSKDKTFKHDPSKETFVTTNKALADNYAGKVPEQVQEIEVDLQNPFVFDATGMGLANARPLARAAAKASGNHDGVIIQNATTPYLLKADVLIVFPKVESVKVTPLKVKTKVLHALTPTDILSGSALTTPEVVIGINEITGIAEDVLKDMPSEAVLKLILGKMSDIPVSDKGSIYANITESGLLTDANKSIWFDAYKLFLADAPFVSSQEERTAEALKAYSAELSEEVTQLASEEVVASEVAADSFTAMNDLLPEPVERVSGSVVEQKQQLNTRRVLAPLQEQLNELYVKAGKLADEYAASADFSLPLDEDAIKAAQAGIKAEITELKDKVASTTSAFVKARDVYLMAEEVSQKATEVTAAKQEAARMAKAGKTPYDMEAATRSQYSRINLIAETIAVAKYNLDILSVAIGMKPAVLKAIVRGETKSTQSISQQIANEINTNILSKSAAKSTVEAYIQDSIFTLGSLVEETLVGKRGGKKKLGIKTLPAIQESFRQKFAKDIRTMPENHPAKALLNSLREVNPLKTSLGSFKESALWDMSSVLNLTPDNTVAMAEFAEKHDVLMTEVMSLVQDYTQFKAKFENSIQQAIKSEPINDRVDMSRVSVLLIDEHGNIPEHFIQTSFLSYAEAMEYIGHTKYLPRKQLKMYVDKIDRGNTSLQATFAGKGTFLSDSLINGAVGRNTKLVEAFDQNQYLPALNTFLASVVTRMVGETKGVDMVKVKHNNKSYYGYTRNPEVNSNSVLLKGDTKILKAEYGVRRARLNHIGTPPNTDYSHLPVKAREMAELTEGTPFYLDTAKFELMLKSVIVEVDGEVALEATARNFVEQYLHEPTEKVISELNLNDALAKRGKKEGYMAEFTSAYELYTRLQEESANEKSPHYNKAVPIYYSSFFSANGRQFFEGEVNPQANKLHRILVRTSFNRENIKVHGSRAKMVKAYKANPTTALKHYVLALGLGLGVKVDKQSNEVSLTQTFTKLFQLGKEIKSSKAKTIPEFLAWQEENSSNYSAPTVEYIESLDSIFSGYTQKPLPIEVDGKTNGVFHSNWAYAMGVRYNKGYSLTGLLAMGGLKNSLDAKDTHHDAASEDMYETISHVATRKLRDMKLNDEWSDDTVKAWAFLKDQVSFVDLAEVLQRNASKAGVTSTVYGGSAKALVAGLVHGVKSGEGFLAKFYKDVSAAIGTPPNSPERAQLYAWNDVFWAGTEFTEGNSLPSMDDTKLTNYTLTDKQQADITKHVKATLGNSLDRAISDVLYRSKDVTNQVTMATGTMVALYNMAQVKLTAIVVKKRKLPPTASLSKEDSAKIKQALSAMFPELELSIEGLTFLNKRARAQDSKQQKGTTVPVFSVDTESDVLAKSPESVHVGVAPLKEAGVTANPNSIISMDGETMRLTTKIMKAVTGTLHLNVFDAQDISSGSGAVLGAFITNLAETITIMTADPVKKVADTLTGVLEASAKPLLFEGEVVITSLNSLLESGTAEFTADYADFLNELSTELGGRTESGDYTNLLGSGDIAKHLQELNQKLNTTAKQGEISRLEYVATSDGGIKVHQLAGIDGTATLINSDGSFNWNQMQQESGLTDAQIDKLKTLPEVVEFENSFKERIDTRSELTLEVPLLENIPEEAEKSHKVNMMEKLAGIILSKGTFKDFSKEKGFTEIKVNVNTLRDFNFNRINLGSKIDTRSRLPAPLATTLFQVEHVWDSETKQYVPLDISKSNLNGQVIRIVDKKHLGKYGLTAGIKGRHVIEKSAPNAKTGLVTHTPIIYIPEGISIDEAMAAMQHELTHADMVGGIKNILAGNGTPAQHKLYAAFKQDMQRFLALSEDTLASRPTLHNLWLVLQDINATPTKSDLERARKEYRLIQEYAAHLNQNPADMDVDFYLRKDITTEVGAEVVGIIQSILKSLSNLLNSLVGSWINKGDFPKNNDNHVNRITLLQAFMAEMGKTSNITQASKETISAASAPLNSEDRLNNRFTDRSYTVEESTRLAGLRDKVVNAITGLEVGVKELIENNQDVGGIKKSDTKAYKEFVKYSNVLKDSTSKLRILSAKGALKDAEVEILSQLTGVLSIGRDNKYYQRRHLDKIYLQASRTIKVSDLVPASIKESDPSYVTHLRMAADVHTLLFKTDDANRVARFAAYSEVSPELKAALKTVDIKETSVTSINWFEKVRQAIRDAVVKSANALSGIRAGDASLQTQMTIDNMFLSKRLFDNKFSFKMANYEGKLNASLQFGGRQLAKAVRLAISKISGKEVPEGVSLSDMILDYTPRGEGETTVPGFWRTNLLEIIKRTEAHSVAVDRRVDIGKSKVDAVHTGTARGVKTVLANIFSKTLTKDESRAIVEGDIKADLGSLIEEHGMSVKDVQMLLEDASTRNTRINILQNQILNTTVPNVTKAHQTMMINEAKALGYRLVQGGATRGMGYPNAYSISRLTGTSAEVEYSPTLDSTLVPMLDQLAALSAIQYMDSGTRETLAELYSSEEGAFNVIHAQVKSNQMDLVTRYGSSILNQLPKGNTPDITDVNRSIRIVAKSQLSEFPTHEVLHEVNAPHSTEKHYVIYNDVGGAVPYVSGAISLIDSSVSLAAKGVVRSEGLNLWDSGDITRNNATAYTGAMSSKIREPSPINKGGYVPNLNQSGQIVSYKYELPRVEYTRLAGVSGDWSDMLAEHSGRLQAEKLGTFNNDELVKELHAEYTKSNNKKAWVRVAKDSTNRQVREAWQLAPQAMKDTAKTYFGEPVIYVHRDDINQALGFRELSIKALFKPEGFDEGSYMRTTAELMQKVFHPRIINLLRKAELGTQEVVSVGKDLIVVKSVVVPTANLTSNINQLIGRGIPVEEVYSKGLLAINAKRDYDTVTEQLYVLQAKLKIVTDVAEKAKLNSEFTLLKESRESNPLFRLISEEGLNPSVIEELGEESKRDGFRKKFLEGLSAKFENTLPDNNAFVDLGREGLITQDSSIYKLLNEGLELGDFVSKFILYSHLTEQEGMSHEDAIEQARSEFINYNRNQNPLMDYANKLGVTPFFKYFMRKHPVMWATLKKNPSRTVVQILTATQLGVPSLFETSVFNKDLVAATGTVNFLDMASGAHPFI